MVYLNRDFKVDNFWASFPEEFTFFLSHNHEDHLTGLNKGGNYGGGASAKCTKAMGRENATNDIRQ